MAATRWLTFDCYGTIADWNACMLSALEPVAGAAAGALLAAYHRAESILEAGPKWRSLPGDPHRRAHPGRAADRGALPPAASGALVEAWPRMTIFPDVAEALAALVSAGWHLAVLTNCDDDLFAGTAAGLPRRSRSW